MASLDQPLAPSRPTAETRDDPGGPSGGYDSSGDPGGAGGRDDAVDPRDLYADLYGALDAEEAYAVELAAVRAEITGDLELIRRLETLPAGPLLIDQLDRVDPSRLAEEECLAYAQALYRQQGWTEALLVRTGARFLEHRPGPPPQWESLAHGSEKRIHLGGELTPPCGSFAAAEWGAATGSSTWSASRLLADSIDLVVRLPGLLAATRSGLCDLRTARLVATRTRDLSAHTAALVEQEVLRLLPGLTRAQLERVIDQVADRHEPQTREQRAAQVRAKREVWIEPTDDDHAEIAGTLDGLDARRLDDRLDELARLLGIVQRAGVPGYGPPPDPPGDRPPDLPGDRPGDGPGDGPTDRPGEAARETWQQRRARALGLLADPASIEALVQAVHNLTHPHTNHQPPAASPGPTPGSGSSPGCGSSPGSSCGCGCGCGCGQGSGPERGTAHSAGPTNGGLRATTLYVHLRPDSIVDLEGTGVLSTPTLTELLNTTTVTVRPVIDLNTVTHSHGYQPSEQVHEAVLLLNERCVFPYCDRPARRCDQDHNIPWPHGPTATSNLGPLCRLHHRIKTHSTWQLTQAEAATYLWRSPTGRHYVVTPTGTHRLPPAPPQ